MRKSLLALAVLAVAATAMLALSGTASGAGAIQVSGLGNFGVAGEGNCTDLGLLAGADYLIDLSGDLNGCVYGYITAYKLVDGPGIYKETADETFKGCYGATCGTFDMVENFHTKFDVVGFCKHPIVKGSGTDGFAGVTGRLDFRDDLVALNAPYTGHLNLG